MKKISKEDVLNLPIGSTYIVYNPLTKQYKPEKALPNDIAHNKYAYEKLEFYTPIGEYDNTDEMIEELMLREIDG